MRQYTILVPQTFNDGETIPPAILKSLQTQALRMFGGLTMGETVSGLWEDGGKVYRDTLTPYIVASVDQAAVLAFAADVATACDQISVYVSQSADSVWFVNQLH